MTVCPLCGTPRDDLPQPAPAEALETDAPAAPVPPEVDVPAGDAADGVPAEPAADESPEDDAGTGTAPAGDEPDVPVAGEVPEAPADKPAPRKKPASTGEKVAMAVAIVLLLAAIVFLAVRLWNRRQQQDPASAGVTDAAETTEDDAPDPTEVTNVDESGNFVPHSYTKPAAEVTAEDAAAVVASCAGQTLTNSQLSFYYLQQYSNFLNSYGSYALLMGLDPSQPLSEQMRDETHTWEDTFLQTAVSTFWQTAAIAQAAEADGYQLDEYVRSFLESGRQTMEEEAAANGQTPDAYIQSIYGPHTTMDGFMTYYEQMMTASGYLSQLYQSISYGEADVEAYLQAHAEEYAGRGIELDGPNMVNVRHILIMPQADEGAEVGENGQPVLTEQNWTDARLKAEEIYDLWQSGEATEASFGELAQTYSEDGSAANGGLIEDIYPGQMVANFNDWCFDASRQPGDHGIVETEYGYHIMYFSGTAEHNYAYAVAESEYVAQRQEELLDSLLDAAPITVDYTVAVLPETVAADDADAAADDAGTADDAAGETADDTGETAAEAAGETAAS